MTKVTDYTVIHFTEEYREERSGSRRNRPVVLIYALGEDGILYEMAGGKWLPLPIEPRLLREFTPAKQADGD